MWRRGSALPGFREAHVLLIRLTPVVRSRFALLLLLLTVGSFVESVVGPLRERIVHHESAETVRAHTLATNGGEHAHEDSSVPAEHQRGPAHQHGTALDHCTHQHTAVVPSPFAWALASTAATASISEPLHYTSRRISAQFHPPRA
jgi:hypothetical protein